MAKGIIVSIDPQGREVLSNILCEYTGINLTYKEVETYEDGTVMNDTKLDGIVYIKRDGKYFRRDIERDISPEHFGARPNDSSFDSTTHLQAFFDFIVNSKTKNGVIKGEFYISSSLFLGRPTASPGYSNGYIQGNVHLRAMPTNDIDVMLTIRNCRFFQWDGKIELTGRGGSSFASRTTRGGLRMWGSGRSIIGSVFASNFREFGLCVDDGNGGNNSMCKFGLVRASFCGSGMRQDNASLTATWDNKISEPTRSWITVSTMPDAELMQTRGRTLVIIDGEVYYIIEVDRDNNAIQVEGRIDDDLNEGVLRYVIGGAVQLKGADSGIIGFDLIDAVNCGCGIDMMSLYGPNITRIVAQSCTTPIVCGLRTDSAMVSYNVGSLYTEGNAFDHIQVTQATSDGGYFIGAEYALRFNKVTSITSRHPSLSHRVDDEWRNTGLMYHGDVFNYEKRANSRDENHSRLDFHVTAKDKIRTYFRNSWLIRLDRSLPRHNTFGYNSATLVFVGAGPNGSPTGTFNFFNSDGIPINGISEGQVSFQGFTGPAVFSIYLYLAETNPEYYVYPITSKNVANSGTTGNRPLVEVIGYPYFDTTLGRQIWWSGTEWVDAEGTAV